MVRNPVGVRQQSCTVHSTTPGFLLHINDHSNRYFSILPPWCAHVYITCIFQDHNLNFKRSFKGHQKLQNGAVSFILKIMGTGSGTALLCGLRVAQARAAIEESQTRVANIATISRPLGRLQLSKGTLDQTWTFFWFLGECRHRHQDILVTR